MAAALARHGQRCRLIDRLTAALAFWTTARGAEWSIPLVRLAVDTGLRAIVLASLLIGTPFTLQYAREETPPEIWGQPEFLRTNR